MIIDIIIIKIYIFKKNCNLFNSIIILNLLEHNHITGTINIIKNIIA